MIILILKIYESILLSFVVIDKTSVRFAFQVRYAFFASFQGFYHTDVLTFITNSWIKNLILIFLNSFEILFVFYCINKQFSRMFKTQTYKFKRIYFRALFFQIAALRELKKAIAYLKHLRHFLFAHHQQLKNI